MIAGLQSIQINGAKSNALSELKIQKEEFFCLATRRLAHLQTE